MAAKKNNQRGQVGAPSCREKGEAKKGRRGPVVSPESTKSGSGITQLRQAKLMAWGRDWLGNERGKKEEGRGFYRRWSERLLMAINEEESTGENVGRKGRGDEVNGRRLKVAPDGWVPPVRYFLFLFPFSVLNHNF